MKKQMINPMFFVFISAALIVIFHLSLPLFNIIPHPFNLTGIVVALAGFHFMGRTKRMFSKHQTTIRFKKSTTLIKEGPFSVSRNPMYFGMFILLLGIGICFRNLFSLITPFVFIIMVAIVYVPREETLLSDVFGQDYEEYKKNVRKWI